MSESTKSTEQTKSAKNNNSFLLMVGIAILGLVGLGVGSRFLRKQSKLAHLFIIVPENVTNNILDSGDETLNSPQKAFGLIIADDITEGVRFQWEIKSKSPQIYGGFKFADEVTVPTTQSRLPAGTDNYDMVRLWNDTSARYATYRSGNSFSGLNNSTHTIPGNSLVLTSSYRNPERNEYYRGATGSRHMMGRATDMAFSGLGSTDEDNDASQKHRGALFGFLWQMMVSDQATHITTADRYALEGVGGSSETLMSSTSTDNTHDGFDDDEDNIPDDYEKESHLHIQDNP